MVKAFGADKVTAAIDVARSATPSAEVWIDGGATGVDAIDGRT